MITHSDDYFTKGCGRCGRFETPDCSVHLWSQGLAALRQLCLEAGLTETVKWGHPCYQEGDRNIALLGAHRDCYVLTFCNAALLKDPEQILERAGPNTQTADLVRFADVRDVVAAASVAVDDVRRRVAATPAARPYARDAAMQRRDAVTDAAYARVVDAVADAADGYEPDAVAVVIVPSASFGAYATLQRAGVACIRPAAPADCAPSGAWCGTDGVRPSLSFLNVADALAYATGHAAPSRMPRRARRSPVLPGETTAPAAQSHGAAAPTLPRLSGAAR